MQSNKRLILFFFILLIAFAFFAISSLDSFAQEEAGFDDFSMAKTKEQEKEKSLDLDMEAIGVGPEAQKYYRFLSDKQKKSLIEGISPEERVRIFNSLSEDDKLNLFESLTYTEKRNLFNYLNDADKKKVFRLLTDVDKKYFYRILEDIEKRNFFTILDDTDKKDLFNILEYVDQKDLFSILVDEDKRTVLSSLSDIQKLGLINSLSEMERDKWLLQYPELKIVGPLQEAPPKKLSKTIEEEGPPLSDIEKFLSGEFPTEISRTLRQFGYDFFEKGSSAFAPEMAVPVGPDYLIGPFDQFTVHLWGRTEEVYNVTVSRDGRIALPRLGALDVGGLTFSELKKYLMNKFREYYPDFEMNITMGALRTVEVFMIGEMVNPGTYSLNALSTVISALFTSGGPSKKGTLRNIKVFNNGELVKTLDLYDFFIKGTKGNDIRLQQGYTIFVPVLGPVVGIAGHVKRPAIYEMKDPQTIGEIIQLAGGILSTGYLQNVVVERIIGHQKRVVNSFNLDPSSKESNRYLEEPIRDGDLIKIYPIDKRMEQVVYLEGHVKYPREYELKQGMTLLDIIPSFDYLLPEPFLHQAEIVRLMPPDLHPEIVEFNLGGLLAGVNEENLLLQDQDRIRIYSIWDKSEIPEVTINGSVRNPGVYRMYKDMTVKDLIFQAGNLTSSAYMEKASLTRIIRRGTSTDIVKLSFSPDRAIKGIPEDNLTLQDDDQVYIREIPKYKSSLERKVYLEGEFLFPGEYSFSEGERLSSVIERAGGLTNEAYPQGAVFQRESVKEIQKERMNEYINKLEQDIVTTSTFAAETSLDSGQVSAVNQSLATKQDLMEKLRKAEPTGRMVIKLSETLLLPSSGSNIELRPGDRLIVGRRPDSVNIIGEAYNPTALLYEKGKTVDKYLSLVGGPTENAEKGQIYIVKADGSVISKKQGKFGLFDWNDEDNRWTVGSFNSIELDPGDTIIIPRKIFKFAWMRYIKDITEVIYQIAVVAGVLHTGLGII